VEVLVSMQSEELFHVKVRFSIIKILKSCICVLNVTIHYYKLDCAALAAMAAFAIFSLVIATWVDSRQG
jgi:hypothetical protein